VREQIPLSAAIGVRVLEAGTQRVRIEAPLEPNRNHRSTAFGGSVAALAILAGWALVHTRLSVEGSSARTVIHESSMRYDAPIQGSFTAICEAPAPEAWARFTRTLARRGRARVRLAVRVECEGRVAARGEGAYVALGVSAGDVE
jgi:thioesterase domain-containing protein